MITQAWLHAWEYATLFRAFPSEVGRAAITISKKRLIVGTPRILAPVRPNGAVGTKQ